jgi:hypothetical protein
VELAMTQEQITQIINAVLDDRNWEMIVAFAIFVIISCVTSAAASYFGSYFSKKGEQLATKQDIEKIVEHTGKTARATADATAQSQNETDVKKTQFTAAYLLNEKLIRINTNINRMRHGTKVKGFIIEGDCVPLTEVYEELLARKSFLYPEIYEYSTGLQTRL